MSDLGRLAPRPTVSVVMGVYNGAARLSETLDSVLSQKGVSFEVVVVDDGSTDDSPEILEATAKRDDRVRWVRQENLGLTMALVRGCRLARGRFIARQDVGDASLPGRLEAQARNLFDRSDAGLVSCASRFVGPRGEHLYDVLPRPLQLDSVDDGGGPAGHGSVMFRKSDYVDVGGYRSEFYYAQDVDLWQRLLEVGAHVVIPEVLYLIEVTLDSLSAVHRNEQIALRACSIQSARLRRNGRSDSEVLKRAAGIRPTGRRAVSRFRRASAAYFIGACLRRAGNERAAEYFRLCARQNPLHVKAWAGWVLSSHPWLSQRLAGKDGETPEES